MMIEKLQTLISKEKLAQRVSEIASEIERDYQGKDIHFICVLKGGVVFMADLARAVHQNVYLHFMMHVLIVYNFVYPMEIGLVLVRDVIDIV